MHANAATAPYVFEPAARTLPEMLSRQAATHRDRALFVCGDARWSFAQTADVAARQAAAFARAGISRGERVALLCSNRPEFMRVVLGCAWLGAIVVPINAACRAPQLRYYLEDSGATTLVIEATLIEPLGDASEWRAPALARVWTIGEPSGDAAPSIQALPLPAATDPPAAAAALAPGDPLAILYTSGTTGPSKGVVCPHAQFHWWGVNSGRVLGVDAGDVLCTTLPLFHTNALNCFFQALLHGATQVVERRFSASAFWPTMARHGATVGYLLGAMVPILLARTPGPEETSHRMRIALAPGVPRSLHDAFRERTGVVLREGYGSTETNFVIADTGGGPSQGAMGRVLDGFEARVADEHDDALPDGVAGELLLRAHEPWAFAAGYHGRPEATVEAWRNLWFHTGDRVVRHADGSFEFLDRLKDAIRRRGENVSSFEVEQVLSAHPAIEMVAVYPVRSELAEDEVMAAIVPRSGERIDPLELIRYCDKRLPYFAVPRFVAFVDSLPRTENGKIQKFRLREVGVTPGTWDREANGYVPRRT